MIRERREELTTLVPFAVNTEQTYPNGLPRDLPLTRLMLTVEGRYNITAQTTPGTFLPEAPVTLIRNLQLKGTKVTGGGSITLVNASGEELSYLSNFYKFYTPLGPQRQQSTTPNANQIVPGAATFVQGYDFRFNILVPVAPFFATQEDEVAGILDPAIFSQLDLVVRYGDPSAAFFQGGTGITATVNAYGSATGVPTVRVTRFSPLAAGLRINQFHYTHLSRQVNMGTLPATGTDTKIVDLQVGNKIRAILFRQYEELSGQPKEMASPNIGDGVQRGLFRFRVKVNGAEKVRITNQDLREFNAQQAELRGQMSTLPTASIIDQTGGTVSNTFAAITAGAAYAQADAVAMKNAIATLAAKINGGEGGAELPLGYAMQDWGDRGFLEDIFDTRGYGATATRFELMGDWLLLTANSRLDLLQIEQVPVEA